MMSVSRAFFLGSVVLLAGCGSDVAQSVEVESEVSTWVRRLGRSSDSEAVGLAAFDDGGVVMVGRYYGDVDFGGGKLSSPNGNYQAFVVKYDGSGKHVYSKSFGNEFAEAAIDVATYSDGSAVVTGRFNWPVDFGAGTLSPIGTDIFVLKLDPSGKTVWSQRFGGEGTQRPTALAAMPDGGAVVVGTGSGKFDVGLGSVVDTSNDGFVFRLNSKGEPLWADVLFSDNGMTLHDVAVHAQSGVIAIGGSFNDRLSMGTLPDLVAEGYQDGFLAAYDDMGKPQWNRAVGGQGYSESVNAIAMDSKHSIIYVTGGIDGQADLGGGPVGSPDQYDPNTYLLGVTMTGSYVASRSYGKKSTDRGYDLAVDQGGNVYVAGEYYDRIAFGALELVSKGNSDAFVGKVGPNLDPTFQQGWGDAERQTAYRVAIDGSGRVYVAGSVYGTVDFGLGPTYGSGYYETFLLALPR